MPEMTITVRDTDVALLDELAERDWRHREQQASAMIEAALATARARANTADRPRGAPRRTQARTNGAVRVEA
jgi:antitoxin (DNA-binding transcriptional repressor) of toxin-antitoxin stability system